MRRLSKMVFAISTLIGWPLFVAAVDVVAGAADGSRAEVSAMMRAATTHASADNHFESSSDTGVRFAMGDNPACGPGAGPCDEPNGSPGCDDVECCNSVCDLDPFCCDVEWDEYCAGPNIFVPGASCTELCTEPGQPCSALPPGTVDIAVSRIGQSLSDPTDDYYEYGVVGDVAAFSAATTSCNVGNEVAEWLYTGSGEGSSSRHPLIAQNLYRLSADGKRFEMIGMSWLKHGFCALNENSCGSCQVTSCNTLGIGCADTYTASRNGWTTYLGPRRDANPLGFWFLPGDPGTHSHPFPDPSGDETIAGRLQVHTEDLDIPGAEYFVEAHYITHDEPVERRHNNASWLKVSMPPGPEFTGDILSIGTIRIQEVALKAWQESDPGVVIQPVDDEQGGRFHLGYRVTDNGDGTWHYEYALHNMTSHLAANGLVIPAPESVLLTDIEFHDVDYHSGDGDLDGGGGGNFDGTDWTATRGSSWVVWIMAVVGDYNNSNALRWGTTYNFRFDANTPPQGAEATITHYRSTQGPGSITVQTLAPSPDASDCPNACSGNGVCVGGSCDCDPGWEGEDCSIPKCQPPCQNGGTCTAPDTCDCSAGWEGQDCSIPVCPDPCQNGGICSAPDTCTCQPGWGGPVCENPVCEPPCQNGTCTAPGTCTCLLGWEGPLCENPICDPACVQGTCVSPGLCECDTGWEGPLCDDPICNPACVNGTCVAPDVCDCDAGWGGPDCSEPECPADFNGDGVVGAFDLAVVLGSWGP